MTETGLTIAPGRPDSLPGDRGEPAQQQRIGAASAQRIVELDGIRGLAVTLVVFYHYFSAIPPAASNRFLAHLQGLLAMGWSGVDLFFVLSGFLIGGILLDAKESPRYFQTFYLRRFHRILPLYYLWIGVFFLMAATSFSHLPAPLRLGPIRWTLVPIFFLFVQNTVSKQLPGFSSQWFGALWSLAVEEQFYLAMPLLVRFLPKRRLVPLLIVTIVGAPLLRAAVFRWYPTHTAQYVLTPCRADALAMGVLLALIWRDKAWKARLQDRGKLFLGVLFGLLIGVFYIAATHPSPYSYFTSVWGLSCIDSFFAGILLLALCRPAGYWAAFCRVSALRALGTISYCVYVIHLAINAFCHALLLSSREDISSPRSFAVTLLAGGMTWALAKISWRYFEAPLVRRSHAYRY